MSRTRLDLVLPATPVVPGVSSRLSLADERGVTVAIPTNNLLRFKLNLGKNLGE